MKLRKCFHNWLILLLVATILVAGCATTIVPKPVVSHQAAFSTDQGNSGFVGFALGGEGIITERAKEKYNLLIDIYGGNFLPPISRDFGIAPYTNGTYLITKEALSDYMLMNQWRRDGK